MGSPHMGKLGAGDCTQKKHLISDIWEKWGSPRMGKRGAGDLTQKKNSISDIWEKWGSPHMGEMGMCVSRTCLASALARPSVARYSIALRESTTH